MTDDEDGEEPAVTLGTQRTVEGAPLARVSARLMWGIEKSAVEKREGETVIRTPDGPRELGELLTDVDKQYFSTQQEFEAALADVIGDSAIPTEGDHVDEEAETAPESEDDETTADAEQGESDAETSGQES
jgi:hypothetical protein